jgi:DNA-3-methyladenine glycosylase II
MSVASPEEIPVDIAEATREIAWRDPAMAACIERVGPCLIRPGLGDYFSALVRSIAYQQLAGRAAAAIHGRFVEAIGGAVTAEAVMAASEATIRSAGMSGAKTASLRDLAAKVLDGTVPLDGIEAYPDDEIIERLVKVRGIGRWTAEMFLLFELRRLDVWPVDDFAVRKGYSRIHGLDEMPKPKELTALGEVYRPWRSVAAWYCWRGSETTFLPEAPQAPQEAEAP